MGLLQSSKDMDTESLATTVLTGDGFFQLPKPPQDGTDESGYWFGSDTFVYATLSVLTQIDLIVYILIWVAFTCTMTRNGMACIRSQFFRGHEEKNAVVHRRYVIVLGAFVAWSTVDMYLGYPIPMKPIVLTVGIDLVLCYMMVCCFDMGGRQRQVFGCGNSDEQEIGFDDLTRQGTTRILYHYQTISAILGNIQHMHTQTHSKHYHTLSLRYDSAAP